MKIIFVCTGNTCRSPMAQGYLSSKNISGLLVESRGIFAMGEAVSINSSSVMQEMGIDISNHISSSLTKEDINSADRIICLSSSHKVALVSMGVPIKKLSVLGEGIPDPYGSDIEEYRNCRDTIIKAIDLLLEQNFFSSFTIVPMEEYHISAVAKLESLCFSEPWSAEGILDSLNHGTKFFVAQNEEDILGYIGFSLICNEGYVTNVAVFPHYRKQGVGTALVNQAIAYCDEQSAEFLSLEVRESNKNAISLYQRLGFEIKGERKNFYHNPNENAFIMTKYF